MILPHSGDVPEARAGLGTGADDRTSCSLGIEAEAPAGSTWRISPRGSSREPGHHDLTNRASELLRSFLTASAPFGLPEISLLVTKTELPAGRWLVSPHQKQQAMPPSSPKGQLPYIDDDGERVADSTFIRAHIERKYGFDFDDGLDPLERAQAWAFERMIEHHLYWALRAPAMGRSGHFAKASIALFRRRPESSLRRFARRRAVAGSRKTID